MKKARTLPIGVHALTSPEPVSATAREVQSAELHRMTGRIQAAQFMETVSAMMIAETYIKAKALIGEAGSVDVVGSDGQRKAVSDIESFCEHALPLSARRCRQLVAAIDTLGPDLFKQAEQVGFRARDYQSLNALPLHDQAVVKAALAGESASDAVLDILSKLAANNKALQTKADEDRHAMTRVIETKNKRLDLLEEQLAHPFKPRPESAAQTAEEMAQLKELQDSCLVTVLGMARMAVAARDIFLGKSRQAMLMAAQHDIEEVCQRMADIVHEHGLHIQFDEVVNPTWLDEAVAKDRELTAAKKAAS